MKDALRKKIALSKRGPLAVLTICALGALVYLNACPNTFHYDDQPYVVENRLVSAPGEIDEIFVSSYPPGKPRIGLYRPMIVLSYTMDGLVWGLNPFGFHLTNLLLHLLAALLVYVLGLRLLRNERVALAGALLFVAHPVHTESVSWVVGRAEVLCTVLFLAGVIVYLSSRKGGHLLSCLTLYFLALLCKENALTLPLIFLCLDLTLQRRIRGPRKGFYTGLLLATLIFFLIRLAVLGRLGPEPAQRVFWGQPTPTRIATILKILLYYVRLLLFPVNLNIEYADSFSLSLLEPLPLLGLIFLVFYTLFLFRLWREKKEEAFLLLWPFVTLLTVLNIVPIGEFLAERFLYLPSVGFCILLAALGRALLPGRGRRPMKRAGSLLLLAVLLLYSVGTIRRNGDYVTPLRLWENTVRRSPGSPKAQFNYGWSLFGEKRYRESLHAYETAAFLDPRFAEGHFAVAVALEHLPGERYGEGFDIERCKALYGKALALRPGLHYARYNLAVLLKTEGRGGEAQKALREVLQFRPRFGLAHHTLGAIMMEEGNLPEAEREFREALLCGPELADTHYSLGFIHMKRREPAKALRALERALRIEPSHAESLFWAGVACNWLGRDADARRLLERALQVKPAHAEAHLNLGLLLDSLGERRKAKGHLERYLELKPEGPFAGRARKAMEK